MHILIFCEQHPHTLGGAQTSVVLQAKFLERAGHVVTFVSPALRSGPVDDPRFIDLPSWPIPTVREYTWLWPSQRHVRLINRALSSRPAVDVVHVQSDFWGAAFGYRFARDNSLPLVHTMHNRLDVGVDGSVPFPQLFYAMLALWQKWSLRESFARRPRTAFEFLGQFAAQADAVIAPSQHFARLLESRGVRPKSERPIDVVPTGIDDDVLTALPRSDDDRRGPLSIAWVGRFSPEKRLIEFCEALRLVTEPIAVTIVGDGRLSELAHSVAPAFVTFTGGLPYSQALAAIGAADLLVQSSHNFETQGMTVTEALALGTHVLVVDQEIAGELPAGTCTVTTDLSAEAMAREIDQLARRVRHDANEVSVEVRNQFRQSSRTAEALDVYESIR